MRARLESRCLPNRLFGFPLRGKTFYDDGTIALPSRLRIRKMTDRSSLTVVLAAGEGTRMRSATPKVLHPVASQSLLSHVLAATPHGAADGVAVVVGPDHEVVAKEALHVRPDAATFVQRERL